MVESELRIGDRPGFYLRIVSSGEIESATREALEAALALPTLGPEWRESFRRQLP